MQDPKIGLVTNNLSKPLAPWWRSFEYVTIKNENDEFEPINGFISCLKSYPTIRYGSANVTKYFVEHAIDVFL